ncbi:unnamed protein product, partial [Ectocarpus fasciculatus]
PHSSAQTLRTTTPGCIPQHRKTNRASGMILRRPFLHRVIATSLNNTTHMRRRSKPPKKKKSPTRGKHQSSQHFLGGRFEERGGDRYSRHALGLEMGGKRGGG